MKLPLASPLISPVFGWMVVAILALTVTTIFSTYKWWTAKANCVASAAVDSNKAAAEDIVAGNKANAEAFDAGEKAKSAVQTVFVPIEKKVYETKYVSTCTGSLPDSVREGLQKAVDAANGR